MRDIG